MALACGRIGALSEIRSGRVVRGIGHIDPGRPRAHDGNTKPGDVVHFTLLDSDSGDTNAGRPLGFRNQHLLFNANPCAPRTARLSVMHTWPRGRGRHEERLT